MRKQDLKPGDRVRVFSHFGPYKGTVEAVNVETDSRYRKAVGLIMVRSDAGELWRQHPRQCVRLRKKAPREVGPRVERWLLREMGRREEYYDCQQTKTDGRTPYENQTRLVELREGEVPVSRDSLAKAWDKVIVPSVYWHGGGSEGAHFKELATALGLAENKGDK